MLVENTPERREARRWLARRGVVVLYEDNHLLGITKPAGLLSQPGPKGAISLPDLIEAYRHHAEGKPGKAYVGLVHRLDRHVSGAMILAKTSKAASRLAQAFRTRAAALHKTYLAWVQRVPTESEAQLVHMLRRASRRTQPAGDGDPDAKEARLHYVVEARGPDTARLRVRLETGLHHQIRAQLAHVGHPLIGDEHYGGPSAKRPALHAVELRLAHPVGGHEVVLAAPVPDELVRIDQRRRLRPPVR